MLLLAADQEELGDLAGEVVGVGPVVAAALGARLITTYRPSRVVLIGFSLGGMLAAWGTWNFGVGLFPLIYALVEEGSVITAVLGGILTVVGAVLGIVGSVQRVIARRRAGLAEEDYDIPVGMVP